MRLHSFNSGTPHRRDALSRVISACISVRILAQVLLTVTALMWMSGASTSRADIPENTSRARYSSPEEQNALRFTPLHLTDGSLLTLISPQRWSDIAEDVSAEVTNTHKELTKLFGTIPPFRSSVRLMDEESFYEATGAPGWTNAMFFRGEIIIPLSKSQPIDLDNIHRSVKHEYTHAVLSALSKGAIPGWIDEGLAQWIEGEENPALRATLKQYLRKHPPVSLAILQGGFTKLEAGMVPAAYAQSLLAVHALIKAYGFGTISRYLSLVRDDVRKDVAFQTSFNISELEFERKLTQTLESWATEETRALDTVRVAAQARTMRP